jgi:hypothetical protein
MLDDKMNIGHSQYWRDEMLEDKMNIGHSLYWRDENNMLFLLF